ncbi:hypothetical protein TPHA_0A04680 [Tetrapisispora phaffii CBS 4417]|uniref:DNA-directed RNA polymerase III subunit RPC9 n=1 Tax=Tetrapisispora phaffii (strain ATCC 24235 / CBS 4417 / NBRC 1672 / NRRL Y-8282 / UCD 70-5) TaxID=1071381 RepID=G8BNR3_TETPH|nr:hypothetical protein TPHA_0A04680 [Tetrapisispora phaffii CBS 4417]CCE61541.1 hypothetical protein TPHA_0A04680 [Tetrapisispora phaffii CBS 4417]
MKVIEERSAFMCDYEVLQFLSKLERQHQWDPESLAEVKNNKKFKKAKKFYNHPELEFITHQTISYLSTSKNEQEQDGDDEEETFANTSKLSAISKLNDEKFSELVTRLNQFDLYKIEKLQLVNQLPNNIVHLYSIVEECDSRFTEEQVQEILSIIQDFI